MLGEKSKTVGILLEVARSESLVGGVERGKMVLGLDDVEDLFPLFGSWVNTGWVVSADVQENNGVVLGILQILGETVEVETLGVWVVVTVVLPFLSNDLNETSMKGPS